MHQVIKPRKPDEGANRSFLFISRNPKKLSLEKLFRIPSLGSRRQTASSEYE